MSENKIPEPVSNSVTDADLARDGVSGGLWAIIKREVPFFVGLFAVLLFLMTVIWGHFKIPSESMLPTLEVGDHIYVSKMTYGYSRHSLPLNLHKLPLPDGKIFSKLPERGDIAVFRNPRSGMIMIKRVTGLPGDTVQVKGGRLIINGQMVERTPLEAYLYRDHKNKAVVGVDVYEEQLPGEDGSHIIYEQTDLGLLDNTEVFNVPPGHVFFMGDNRDNSTDARDPRGPGYVPLENLMGEAKVMMFSFKRCAKEEGLRCPKSRWMVGL